MINVKKEIKRDGKAVEELGLTINAFEAGDEDMGLAVFELYLGKLFSLIFNHN